MLKKVVSLLYQNEITMEVKNPVKEAKDVLNGWENFINKNEVTEKLATERAKKCAVCPHLKHGILLAFIKDDLKEIEGCYCGICKCPTSALVRSENKSCSKVPPEW